MKIAMFTNLYLPLVGGIQKSIATFKAEFEQRGHRVLVVTPSLEEPPPHPDDVVQVPAIQNFNGTDFSVAVPVPGFLTEALDAFGPELIHSHHPFLLGSAAVRAATKRDCPLVFTYHTMWEHYLHYAPADSPAMQRFVKRMAVEYCNLCDHVIAPCESIAAILRERGVETPIAAIPTGIDAERFQHGDRQTGRAQLGLPEDAFVAGYIGRLGPEKNLGFAARALVALCQARENAQAVIVGNGEVVPEIQRIFDEAGLSDRLHLPGILKGEALVDAYHALDAFVFASKSETQGLVLAEAMAAGRPVVALDAPGAREIVRDGENGRLLQTEQVEAFRDALLQLADQSTEGREALQNAARETSAHYTSGRCAERVLDLYERLRTQGVKRRDVEDNAWTRSLRQLATEWQLWRGRAAAAGTALSSTGE
jgi:1,2-diacylglycerol 3-alpha-glucosyltransferase